MKHTFALSVKTNFTQNRFALFSAVALFVLLFTASVAFGQKSKAGGKQSPREYIEIKVYHASDAEQLATIDQYLQASLLPALEKGGFKRTGVFRAIDNDTAKDKRMYVLVPFQSLLQLELLSALTNKTFADSVTSPAYTRAAYNKSPFTRMETILLKAFEGMPQVKASGLKTDVNERVYELRSYESATEPLHQNKVRMFNNGEVTLFERLGFNAVFYGQVIAGCKMPNLMYMTSFENKAARDEHWKAFGNDPQWKEMSGNPIYKNNVSHIDITFLRPTPYSKL